MRYLGLVINDHNMTFSANVDLIHIQMLCQTVYIAPTENLGHEHSWAKTALLYKYQLNH